jgi:myo-inositol-1(or 4)-monophosphatase
MVCNSAVRERDADCSEIESATMDGSAIAVTGATPRVHDTTMTPLPSADPLAVCEAAARAGGRVLQDWVGRFGVSSKGPRDLVTEADFAAQREIRRVVLEAFPEHGFVGEEAEPGAGQPASGAAGHAGRGTRWIVDPLDGTTNYVHGFPAYCVSIALAVDDTLEVGVIFDPVRGECFAARRGGGAFLDGRRLRVPAVATLEDALVAVSFPPQVSAESAAAINLAYVACGRLHAFWARRIACWDAAAGLLIAREAGATVEPFAAAGHDVPLDDPAFIVTSSSHLMAELRMVLRAGRDPGSKTDASSGSDGRAACGK